MRNQWHTVATALAFVIGGATLPPVFGQDAAGQRTPWGDPDLQGIWDSKTQTPLQRVLPSSSVVTPRPACT